MDKPKISAITVTFGRVSHLQTALRDFLAQDYENRELVVVNSCTEQTLEFQHPLVRILNLNKRPPSLGACRNIGVEAATGSIIVTHDDDDLVMPFHFSNFAEHFTDGIEWVWFENQFYSEGGKILKHMSGSYNTFAFTKPAWEKAGKYNELSVGEDKHFVGRVTGLCPGQRVNLPEDNMSFIYCWGNGAYHVSGLGEDTGSLKPAYERVAEDLYRRFTNNLEPKGIINLIPADPQDLTVLVKEFKAREFEKSQNKQRVCIVELGRFGDIANLLPICRHIAENYAKPHLMVAREFASILEGVSYVIPEIVDLSYDRLDTAMQMARRRFPIVLRGQIWGKNHTQEKRCASYNMESWRELGFLCRFTDPTFELNFDLRDKKREAQLISKLDNGKPMLLVQVTSSVSSPFPGGVAVLDAIRSKWGGYMNVIDLNAIRAEKIYDIIGLMDKAVGVVAIDTAVIHLAAASVVPVVALVNPLPWAGSVLRCNCVERIEYDKATPEVVLAAIHKMADAAIKRALSFFAKNYPVKYPPTRRIFHATERHEEENIDVANRKKVAQSSWDLLYSTGRMLPAHLWKYPRTAEDIGEKRPLPYLKDVLKNAMDQAEYDDIIFFTNDDNILHAELPDVLQFYVSVYDAVCSQRCDINRALPMRTLNPIEMAKITPPHFGRDLFAFKKSWLLEYWDEIGDFILGASDWDVAMTALIRLYHGMKSTRESFIRHIFPAEFPRGYIYHITHESYWARPDYVNVSPANQHNRLIWRAFAEKHLPELKFTKENCI